MSGNRHPASLDGVLKLPGLPSWETCRQPSTSMIRIIPRTFTPLKERPFGVAVIDRWAVVYLTFTRPAQLILRQLALLVGGGISPALSIHCLKAKAQAEWLAFSSQYRQGNL